MPAPPVAACARAAALRGTRSRVCDGHRSGNRHEGALAVPGGVRIEEAPWQHAETAARTTVLMNDARVPAIFEAASESKFSEVG
jgi:hypothetical protein